MTDAMPPLPWLRAFESAARHGNFSLAAEELGLTPAAVSYQVRALEAHLGYTLFLRKKRPMVLTTMGALYQPWVARAFALVAQGTNDVFGARSARPVRLRCPQSFALAWLVPRLPDFQDRHPEVVVQLHMGTWASTIARDMLDLDIVFGDGTWREGTSELLCRAPIVPVCHPDLAAGCQSVTDLAAAPLIEIIGVVDSWRQFFVQEEVPPPARLPRLQVDQTVAALDLAALGLGHALVFTLYAAPFLRDGRVVRSLPIEKRTEQALYLLTPEAAMDRDCALFRDWLIAAMRDAGPLD